MSHVDDLPGREEAALRGYSLDAQGGSYNWALYTKDGIALEALFSPSGETLVELSFRCRLLTVSTGKFSIPNKNFAAFEMQIRAAREFLWPLMSKG